MQYLQRLRREGTLDSIEAVALEQYGVDLHGFVLVKGDRDAQRSERISDEFVHMIVGVQLVHERVRVVWASTGAEMQQLFEMWDQQEESWHTVVYPLRCSATGVAAGLITFIQGAPFARRRVNLQENTCALLN